MNKSLVKISFILIATFALGLASAKSKLDFLKVPDGFNIEMFSSDVPNARTMVLGAKGTLFVGTRNAGVVYAIKNNKRFVIADGLNMPNKA